MPAEVPTWVSRNSHTLPAPVPTDSTRAPFRRCRGQRLARPRHPGRGQDNPCMGTPSRNENLQNRENSECLPTEARSGGGLTGKPKRADSETATRSQLNRQDPRAGGKRRRLLLEITLVLALLLLVTAGGILVYEAFYPGATPNLPSLGRLFPDVPTANPEGTHPPATDSPAGTEAPLSTLGDGMEEIAADEATGNETTASAETSSSEGLLAPLAADASSALSPQTGNTYGPENMLDSNMATAWNEGASGPGDGEWVRFHFSEPVVITRLEIANRYQKDLPRFQGNGRIRLLRIQTGEGAPLTAKLADSLGYQSVGLSTNALATTELTLTIVSVYPGDNWEDAAISGLKIYGYPEGQ